MSKIFLRFIATLIVIISCQLGCEAKDNFHIRYSTEPALHVFKMNMTGESTIGSDEFLRHAYRNFNIKSTDIKLTFDKKDSLLSCLDEFLDQLDRLSEVEPNAVILLIDSRRTVFFVKKDEILNKFLKSGSNLIVSTSRLRPEFLNENQLTAYPMQVNNSEDQFIDAGALIGNIESCKNVIMRIHRIQEKIVDSAKKVIKTHPKRKSELIGKIKAMNLNFLINLDYISYNYEYKPDFNNSFFFSLGDVKRDEFKMSRIQDGPPFFFVLKGENMSNPAIVYSQPGVDGGDELLKEIYQTFSKGK